MKATYPNRLDYLGAGILYIMALFEPNHIHDYLASNFIRIEIHLMKAYRMVDGCHGSPKYLGWFYLLGDNSFDYLSRQSTQREMASKESSCRLCWEKDLIFQHESEMKTEETNIQHIITHLALTSTSTLEFQNDEDLRTCRRCCDCYRQRFCCRPTCFAFSGYASRSGTWCDDDS